MAIYKVEAPNGKVLEFEGPEGASPEQVKQYAAQTYYADPANAPKDYSLGEIVSKGFGRGAKRIGSTIGDVLPAMGASALGFDEYAKKQMQEAQASEENISRTMAPQYPSYKDVKGVGDAGKFVLETAFEQIPNLFGIIGTGGVGGVAGGIAAKTAAKKATEALTKKEFKKQLSEQASARAAKKILSDINKSKAKGQAAGVFLGSYALNAPEVFQNIYDQTGDFEPLAASLAGIVNASLDSILPASIMKSFSKPGRASVVTEILQKSGMQPGLARRATSNILGGLGTEGLTEATQEAVSIAAEKFVQGHSAIFDSDDFDRMLEAGIKGAVAGGTFKGVASVPEHLREKALTKKASPEKQEEIIEETKLVDTSVTTPVATTQAATTTTEEVVEPQPSTEARDQEAANVLAQQAKVEQLQKDLDTQLLDEKSITQVMEKDLDTYFGGYTETERKQIRNDLKKLRSEITKAKTLGRTAETDAKLANSKQNIANKVNPDEVVITPAMLESVGITADTVDQGMVKYFTERPFSSKELADFGKQAQAMLTKAKTDNDVEAITKFGNLKKALPKLRKEIENARNRTAEYTAGTAGVSDGSVGVSDSITTESTVGPVGAPVVVDPNVAGTVESGTSGEPRSLTQRINALKARIKIDDPQSDIITELDSIIDEDPAMALNFVEQLESEFDIPSPQETQAIENIEEQVLALFPEQSLKNQETVGETPLPSDLSDLTPGKVKPKATEEVVETETIMELRKIIQPVKPKEAAMKVEEESLIIPLDKNNNPIKDEDKKGVIEKDEEIPQVVPAKEITAEERAESDITIADAGGVPPPGYVADKFNKMGNWVKGRPLAQSGTGKELVSFLSTLKDKAARLYVRFLSIPNKIELFGEELTGLKDLLSYLELKADVIKKGRERVSIILRYAEDLITKKYAQTPRGKQLVKEWNRVLLELSRQNIDPETIIADEKARQQLLQENPKAAEFVERYERLPQDLKDLGNQIVSDLRDKYKELLDTIIEAHPDAEASLREQYVPLNYYLPMVRKGNFWFKYVTKDGEEGKASAETAFLRDLKKKELAKDPDIKAKDFEDFTQKQRSEITQGPPAVFIQRLKAAINANPDLSEGAKKLAIENIDEQVLTLFPEQSLRNQEAHRRGIPGYEEDVLYAYSQTAPKIVSSIANAKYNRPIIDVTEQIANEAINSNNSLVKAVGEDTMTSLPFYLNPVAKGYAAMSAYASYVWFIGGNISSALVNLTQIPLVVMPFLQGEYGFDSSYKAIFEAVGLYSNGGNEENRGFLPDRTSAPFTIDPKTGDKTYTGKNAKLFKEGGKYHNLFARAEETAALRRGVGYEITEIQKDLGREVGSGLKIRSKVETAMGYVFQNSERLNREITLIAAFNLARSKGASEADAIQKAIELTSKVHSHALAEAGPSLFQDGIGKVAFVFKRFAQAQLYLVGKLVKDALGKPKTKEDKIAHDIAKKQLIGIYGYSFLMAGIQGMPLYGGATILATLLMDDEDEPYDAHTVVNAAVGDLAYRGPLSQLLGVDISQRTGFRDLVFREDPARLEKIGVANYMLEVLGGPTFAVGKKVTEGIGMIAEGDVAKGLERALPTSIGNGFKTVRYNTAGMTNKYGVPIIEGDPSVYESFMQILGFSNIELSEAYTRANALKGPERKLLKRKSDLLLRYYLARQVGDTEGMEDIQKNIDRFNSKAPKGFRITPSVRNRSMKSRDDRVRNSVNGVYVGKKNRADLEDRFGIPD